MELTCSVSASTGDAYRGGRGAVKGRGEEEREGGERTKRRKTGRRSTGGENGKGGGGERGGERAEVGKVGEREGGKRKTVRWGWV